MAKKQREIKVVLENPEVIDELSKKAMNKLYEVYMEAKLRGELDNI
jgi:hypothetical protein